MATYKLIQDIEAEDHILGPLSLRQFIFGLIAAFGYYLCFIIFVKHVYFLLALFLPPTLFCTFFAVPFGRDQPTEIWALAKLRFWFKPRRRIWDQSGIKELVTITVPKKVERVLTNGLSQSEVESRLKALANTLDSRGWAVKNVNLNAYTQPDPLVAEDSDRLIDLDKVPQEVPSYDIQASDDILDEVSNPIAKQFDSMINASSQAHRQQLMDELDDTRAEQASQQQSSQADYWFMNKAPGNTMPKQVVSPGSQPVPDEPVSAAQPAASPSAPDDTALSARLKTKSGSNQASYSHLRTLKPLASQLPTTNSSAPRPSTTVTAPADPAILLLANNNDLNVSTLARQAHKANNGDEPPQDEIVVSLH